MIINGISNANTSWNVDDSINDSRRIFERCPCMKKSLEYQAHQPLGRRRVNEFRRVTFVFVFLYPNIQIDYFVTRNRWRQPMSLLLFIVVRPISNAVSATTATRPPQRLLWSQFINFEGRQYRRSALYVWWIAFINAKNVSLFHMK